MLGLRKRAKSVVWTVNCKMCGRPFPTPLERQSMDDAPAMNAYQCPSCGERAEYDRDEHHPATA